jgi:pimeloyl-ACP methyl ester carboxylesterase
MTMKFLLIHGGWQGGWSWSAVVDELESRGHRAWAPTMPGLEPGEVDRSTSGLHAYIDCVASLLADENLDDVVVVAHSGGGPIAQGLYERQASRIRQIVFVDAWALKDGERILDILAPEMAAGFVAAAQASPDHTVPMPPEFWIHGLCNDLPEADAMSWLDRVVPCPIGWFTERLSLPTFAASEVATGYIFLDQDVTVDRSIYQEMASRLGRPATTTCPGAHEAMLSQPRALAEAILRVSG